MSSSSVENSGLGRDFQRKKKTKCKTLQVLYAYQNDGNIVEMDTDNG